MKLLNLNMYRHKNNGFTLIEVLIVIAIIGIVSAFALPAYRDYVLRGYLVEATSTLSNTRAQLEQFYQDNRSYKTTGAFVSPCTTLANTSRWTFSCSTLTDNAYTITATGAGPAVGFTYTITQDNVMATTASAWANSTGSCWITRRAGTC